MWTSIFIDKFYAILQFIVCFSCFQRDWIYNMRNSVFSSALVKAIWPLKWILLYIHFDHCIRRIVKAELYRVCNRYNYERIFLNHKNYVTLWVSWFKIAQFWFKFSQFLREYFLLIKCGLGVKCQQFSAILRDLSDLDVWSRHENSFYSFWKPNYIHFKLLSLWNNKSHLRLSSMVY